MAYNSDYFDLTGWKITLPVDSKGSTGGTAVEVKDLIGYEHSSYFYDAPDGAMVFRAMVDGATTSGSSYARTELREMKGTDRAAWKLSEGGTLSATLKVDEVPRKSDGTEGRIVVGQIHGADDELVRLYYEKGKVYFMNDNAGSDNREMKFIFKNSAGQEPSIALGEKFSYMIDARGDMLVVDILADGQVYSSVTKINSIWQTDTFYFKAGVYLGVNESTGTGTGQVSFYGLDFGHMAGSGRDGWNAGATTPPASPVPEDPVVQPEPVKTLTGNDSNNQLTGTDANEKLVGRGGNDVLNGVAGDDELWGNNGNDILIGGMGKDLLKGGPGQDIYTFRHISEVGDTILDFSINNQDRIDVSAILEGSAGFKNGSVFKDGFISLSQKGMDLEVYIDRDGTAGAGQKTLLLTLKDMQASAMKEGYFVLPEDTASVSQPPASPDSGTVTPPPVETEERPFQNTTKSLTVYGNSSANELYGGYGNDTIKGGSGNDILYGGDGNDYLEGNGGSDILVGGRGADKLKGSSGTDIYVYEDVLDFGDTITEFRNGEKIDISAMRGDFSGASGMTAEQMLDNGYLSFSRVSSSKVNLYADLDGAAGTDAPVLVAAISTETGQHMDGSIFII